MTGRSADSGRGEGGFNLAGYDHDESTMSRVNG
jgi:hypothetical protein